MRDFGTLPGKPPEIQHSNGHPNGTESLSKARARKEAAGKLAGALSIRYRKFLESAGDEDATVVATAALAQCMYENIEFVIWALKSQAGLNPALPQPLRAITPSKPPVNDAPLPVAELEAGIIGRDPHFKP